MISPLVFKNTILPAAFIDWYALETNVSHVLERVKRKKIRIATKSIRCVAVLRYLLESDNRFQGLMCYSPHEAIFLSEQGFDDLLLGYPTMDREGIIAIFKKVKEGKKIIFMVDCLEQLILLHELAEKENSSCLVCLDIDMSIQFFNLHFGVHRSPLKTIEDVDKILKYIKTFPLIRLVGVMGYEAQIAGVGDNAPGKWFTNRLIRYLKNKSIEEVKKRRGDIVTHINSKGFELELVNGGGTGSIHTTVEEEVVTEVTVGSAFYSPTLFDYYQDCQYEAAVGFALPIIRKSSDSVYTCSSGGFVASGSIGLDKQPTLIWPKGASLFSLEGAGEVQTPISYKGNEKLKIGDCVLFRPSKAGELAERFTHFYIVKENEIIDCYPTYRGEGRCFL
ncbi:MAG: alanine racemase [Bacillaceae bacterium]